ncbi:MAG: SWIM zinc finger family protein [Terriglobales bacterium]
MSVAIQVVDPQSASLALTLLQSKAGNRWGRAVEEMKTNRLHVSGDFPEFIVTNKSGVAYQVRLDLHGTGSCTCPDFQVRIAREGRICKHIAAAAITALAPQVGVSSPANGNGTVKANGISSAEVAPLIFRIRRSVQTDGKAAVQVEVQARVTNDEEQDRETASYAYELLERLASQAAKNTAPSINNAHREFDSPSAATAMPIKPRRVTTTSKTSPVPAVITKIDRMKTRQGESLFLKVDVGGETVRVFGRPEELAERLEASGYDIPASEIEAGMELHLPCLVKLGQGNSGYKIIEEFLPEAAA